MSAADLHISEPSLSETPVSERAAELRRAFDRSFAETPRGDPPETIDFLVVKVGGDDLMLRLAEIAGVYADKTVVPVPSRAPGLLGIAGFRGAMLPVYDLAPLLGYPPSETWRWLVIAAGAEVALAFDSFAGHLRLPAASIAAREGGHGGHLRQVARTERFVRPVVDIPLVIAAIRSRAEGGDRTQEY